MPDFWRLGQSYLSGKLLKEVNELIWNVIYVGDSFLFGSSYKREHLHKNKVCEVARCGLCMTNKIIFYKISVVFDDFSEAVHVSCCLAESLEM